MARATQQALFPSNTYGVDSGGDPLRIPDLTFDGKKGDMVGGNKSQGGNVGSRAKSSEKGAEQPFSFYNIRTSEVQPTN